MCAHVRAPLLQERDRIGSMITAVPADAALRASGGALDALLPRRPKTDPFSLWADNKLTASARASQVPAAPSSGESSQSRSTSTPPAGSGDAGAVAIEMLTAQADAPAAMTSTSPKAPPPKKRHKLLGASLLPWRAATRERSAGAVANPRLLGGTRRTSAARVSSSTADDELPSLSDEAEDAGEDAVSGGGGGGSDVLAAEVLQRAALASGSRASLARAVLGRRVSELRTQPSLKSLRSAASGGAKGRASHAHRSACPSHLASGAATPADDSADEAVCSMCLAARLSLGCNWAREGAHHL